MRYVIGVDEAGRGALAGPVCVGAVIIPENFEWESAFALVSSRGEPRLRDSKKLSAQQRRILYAYLVEHPRVHHAAAFVDAHTIDEIGIVNAAYEAAALAIGKLGADASVTKVLLDAGLRAPSVWEQSAHIRGDENIPAIAFASIVAKVSRDELMDELAVRYAPYHFEEHKGYGTLVHRTAIRAHGLSAIHRASFCTRLQKADISV